MNFHIIVKPNSFYSQLDELLITLYITDFNLKVIAHEDIRNFFFCFNINE